MFVGAGLIKSLEPAGGGGGGSGALREGMKVEARFRGKARYYPGLIKRVNRDGTFDIDYDDGEKEIFVSMELIRSIIASGSPLRGGGGGGGSSSLREGMKVEARYRGKAKYYPGVIKRENRDGTFDVDYDDGEKEMFLSSELIRTLESGGNVARTSPANALSRSKFRLGQNVEARYRGKTKYYPGKISRDNCDATYDIDYTDGEKEFKVREDYIEASDPPLVLSPVRASPADRPTSPAPKIARPRPSAMSTSGLASLAPRRRAGTP
jgi:hypothetical protein